MSSQSNSTSATCTSGDSCANKNATLAATDTDKYSLCTHLLNGHSCAHIVQPDGTLVCLNQGCVLLYKQQKQEDEETYWTTNNKQQKEELRTKANSQNNLEYDTTNALEK